MTDEKMKRFEMLAPAAWLTAVDDWRRKQPDIPTRAEAIRRLVDAGIQSSNANAAE